MLFTGTMRMTKMCLDLMIPSSVPDEKMNDPLSQLIPNFGCVYIFIYIYYFEVCALILNEK